MAAAKPPAFGRATVWSRAAWGVGQPTAADPALVRPALLDEEEPWLADQPGLDFDAALLASTLGLGARPLLARESVALALALARDPGRLGRPTATLLEEGLRVVTGRSALAPWSSDRRYADPAWRGNPLFRGLAQAHLAVGTAADAILDEAELDPAADYRLRLLVTNVVAALAPANSPLLNPGSLKAIIDTGGGSLVTGARRLWADVRKPPRLPARSSPSEFELGVDVAATPGAVVLRTPMMELIQHETTTPEVQAEPLLIVPSVVNKYYLTDLSPGRSLVEYAVAGGFEAFHMSWINPDVRHRGFGLEGYARGIIEALDAVRAITGASRAHVLGVCAGGQVLTMTLGHLAAIGRQDELASFTLTVSVLDHDEPASPTGLMSRRSAEPAVRDIERKGIVDGRDLATALAWLRPVDSIWWAWVQRYLLAADIPRLDLFQWSEDTTNLPAAFVRDMVDVTLDNLLRRAGALTLLDTPIDLAQVEVDAYVIAGANDNLTPWRSCYRTTRMLGSKCCFVLVSGGHLQAILRPPGGRAAGFRTAAGTPTDPEAWLAKSTERDASWWDHWLAWMTRRSSGTRPAPGALGDAAHPVLERAPGRYARRRLDDD